VVAQRGFSARSIDRFIDTSSMARFSENHLGAAQVVALPPATAAPPPAPPNVSAQPPLRPHEVFGFAPYWTLSQSGQFDVSELTTIAYFGVDVNPDGSLDASGPGWNGFESQALADLETRAHAAGTRVVLTVTCFAQKTLDALTSSPSAPGTLSSALIAALRAKNLDGVNLDFEGEGSADQVGLTNLVTQVSSALHAADPSWQVTMDTYASSAGDPNGFYNVKALSSVVDGLFVMAYSLNMSAHPSASSPLTSTMFSDAQTVAQYVADIPAAKVILGLPFFGYDWVTANGSMTAAATGPATPISDAQAMSGHQIYWDPVTQTGWTSYQVGTQWHESFFEVPSSLYQLAQLVQSAHLGGVGVWALGMEGDDPSMLSAVSGLASAAKSLPPVSPAIAPSTTSTSGVLASPPTTTSSTQHAESTTTTSTTQPGYRFAGVFDGTAVTLGMASPLAFLLDGAPQTVGVLTDFSTDDPTYACLAKEPGLKVVVFPAHPTQHVVETSQPSDCTSEDFTFYLPSS
jgi:hypothetical protein